MCEYAIPLPRSASGAGSRLVRQATPGDLPGIVNIHRKAFSQFFLTKLGSEFLSSYYDLVLHYRAGIMLVSEGPGGLEGLVCGFVDPAEFYRLMWRSRGNFVRAGAFRVGAAPFARRQSPVRRAPDSDARVGVAGAIV